MGYIILGLVVVAIGFAIHWGIGQAGDSGGSYRKMVLVLTVVGVVACLILFLLSIVGYVPNLTLGSGPYRRL